MHTLKLRSMRIAVAHAVATMLSFGFGLLRRLPPFLHPERINCLVFRRIAPLVLIMDEGWTLVKEPPSSAKNKPMSKGTHGYDNQLESMQGMFIAYGEGVAKSVDVGRIYNIEVYQFIAALLDIEPAPHEGRGALLKVLR